jgi:hypothetical protein
MANINGEMITAISVWGLIVIVLIVCVIRKDIKKQ